MENWHIRTIKKTRLRALQYEYEALRTIKECLDKYYKKPYSLDSRIKSVDSILRKIKARNICLQDIPDFIGLRVSVENESDIQVVAKILKQLLGDKVYKDYDHVPDDMKEGKRIKFFPFQNNEWMNLSKTFPYYLINEKGYVELTQFPKTYNAYHIYYKIGNINIEIQIMTTWLRDYTNETHNEYEQDRYSKVATKDGLQKNR